MKLEKKSTMLAASIGVGLYFAIGSLPWTAVGTQSPATIPVVGQSSVPGLQSAYDRWSTAYGATRPSGPVIAVQWTRGLSREYSKAKGIVQLDLENGTVSVRIKGLDDPDIADVWLVDNQPGPRRTVVPEPGDRMIKTGTLHFDGNNAWLDEQIAGLSDFQTDLVVVARRGDSPGPNGVLVGTTSLFQKIYHYPDQTPPPWQQAISPSWLMRTAMATGITPPGFFQDLDSRLINRGRSLFFEETFDGNGRTCGTCHKEDDNMALGIKTIASLPADDPLFIVEQEYRADGSPNPLYNEYRMEKPALMRRLGLIVENLNGFTDVDGNFTTRVAMRAPNHVLSIRTTLAPPPFKEVDDGTGTANVPTDVNELVFADRTGWSGDGTPTGYREDFFVSNGRELTGSLRDFAIGAIVQHFPLTLKRSAFDANADGTPRQPDFRFATEEELNALEAFMLSIGRQQENQDLNDIRLLDPIADRGRLNYMGFNVFDASPNDGRPPLNCNACHFNGGANTNPEFPFPTAVTPNHDLEDLARNGGSIPSHNRSFGPQVERLADQAPDVIVQVVDDPSIKGVDCFNKGQVPLLPGDLPDDVEIEPTPSSGCQANPFDNGFGDVLGSDPSVPSIATNRFNAPPVFEAMDNPPFFHGHQISTVEGSVAFYATNRHLRDGTFLPAIVPFNGAQVINVARFMRVMGADFNAESAITLLEKALWFGYYQRESKRTNMRLASAEIEDAIELLEAAELHFADAIPAFEEAKSTIDWAMYSPRAYKLESAIAHLQQAQTAMVDRNPGRLENSTKRKRRMMD